MIKRIQKFWRNFYLMVCYPNDFGDIESSTIFTWKQESAMRDMAPLNLFERFKRSWQYRKLCWEWGMYHGQTYDGIMFGPFILTYDGL